MAPRSSPAGALWRALAAVTLVAALACRARGEPEAARPVIAQRLIDQEPASVFVLRDVAAAVPVFDWRFADPAELTRWRLGGFDVIDFPRGGPLSLRATRAGAQLVRGVEVEAAQVDAIELEIEGLAPRLNLQLLWAGAEADFDPSRRVELLLHHNPLHGARAGRVILDVGRHPLWKGAIRRLRLDLVDKKGSEVRVRAVRGVAYRLDGERRSAAVAQPWRLELNGEMRSAWFVPADQPRALEVDLPPRGELRFAYGLARPGAGPITFRVVAESAGREATLFEGALPGAATAGAPAWREAVVQLAEGSARRGRLRFETGGAGENDGERALPFFASPEIVRPAVAAPRAAPRPNVLFVMVDTLRADRLSLYGYPRATTPRLDRWARRRAAVFEQAVAPAPWTLPSHVSIFTGLNATRHGVNQDEPAPPGLVTLAELLRAEGYATMAQTGGRYVDAYFGLAQGFDVYRSWRGSDLDELPSAVTQAVDWMRERRDRPFFLFFHTYETHEPFRAREPYFSRFRRGAWPDPEGFFRIEHRRHVIEGRPGLRAKGYQRTGDSRWLDDRELELVSDLYDAGVAFMDEHLARLLAALDELGLADRTLVVLTSDHGDALGEKGLASHMFLYDVELMVPLVVADPRGRGAGRRVPHQVSGVDLMPTILDMVGAAAPGGLDGSSLAPLLDGGAPAAGQREAWSYAATSNHGLAARVDGRWKYILSDVPWNGLQGAEELYDLTADPAEESNLSTAGEEGSRLRRRAWKVLDTQGWGLRVTVSGGSALAVTGTLDGLGIAEHSVKMARLPCPDLTWLPRGAVSFTVAGGASCDFRITRSRAESIALVAEGQSPGGGKVSVRRELEPERLARPLWLAFDGVAWSEGRPSPGGAGILLRWEGLPPVRPGVDEATAGEIRKGLAALGYL